MKHTSEEVTTGPACGAEADTALGMADLARYESGHHIVALESGKDSLKLFWNDGEVSDFHYIWLRDNCACASCRHPEAMERSFDVLSVPLDIRAREVWLTAGGSLRVRWPGARGHVSHFTPGWLRAHCYSRSQAGVRKPKPFWGRPQLAAEIPNLSYSEVMRTDDGLEKWCRFLLDYGVGRVDGVPTEP